MISTIPARKQSCERLLAELLQQTRQPDGVLLVLDGYDLASAPICHLPIVATHRTKKCLGAGNRWLVASELCIEDVIINLDDDIRIAEAPKLIATLVGSVELGGGAAAAMGRTADGKPAPPGPISRGRITYAAGCGLAVRAKHLIGLRAFADQVVSSGGPAALDLMGDDDALVSAYLWKQNVPIMHAATGNIYPAPNTRASSQTAAKLVKKQDPDIQKIAISKITGWPWIKRKW